MTPPLSSAGWSEGETHLRSILATVPDAMVVIDESARILSFSAAAEKMFGFAEAEVMGENVSLLMPSPDRERHDRYMDNYRETGMRKIIGIGRVLTARHRDGFTFPIELSVGEAKVGDKRIFTGFIRDLTERQRSENRLQDLQSELAHVGRVSEVGTLASALAHELNQPLTAIANYCEGARDLLAGEPDGEALAMAREALDEAAQQSVRAGQIVRRLRDFITYGHTERKVERLPRLVAEANALALVGSREYGIEVDVELAPDADRVLVDRIQIQQVLLNLIRNAIEAMIDSPVRQLTIAAKTDGSGMVEVCVADTGKGIPPESVPQIFQPFVTSKEKGMGIGLSICRTIIEAHGGQIWFDAGPDGGTNFHFTIPEAEAISE
ncbi:PAS domain S-box protein [Sphingomonas sp. KRR8]|uniref:sensor histidine kinase n=1 Tax=Sphingomonas sp. KRR8 TaxID=2942996 RepID=UPI00202064A8|nr:PAS domain-containing sensor histidine kinase [Sphingomonas sp. KRR8]URD60045.1 PAS domain S-box protein [Sphingomonas sp. KRR8]